MATTTTTGFDVRCPFCHDDDTNVALDLNTLECHCPNCDEEFTVAGAMEEAQRQAERWAAVQRWVAMAPKAIGG